MGLETCTGTEISVGISELMVAFFPNIWLKETKG